MDSQPPTAQRRRQQRLHLSCTECRRRKTRCDRSKPCSPCTRGNRVDQCQYDYAPASQGPGMHGQFVFEARPRQQNSGSQQSRSSASSKGLQQVESPIRARVAGDVATPAEVIPTLRQFWHGSRAGDHYTSPFDGRAIAVPKEVVFGEDDATVFWGRSHEANFVPRITDMTTMLLKSADGNDITTLLEVERHTRPRDQAPWGLDPELLSLVPPRATADRLWQTYEEQFGSYYRVLHLPTFEREYQHFWATQQGPRYFLPQLLSICAIASCFRDEDRLHRESQVRTWIEAVRLSLFKSDPRTQLTLGFLQAHLLMLIAGDVHWIKIDRSWISSGSLIRNAISAGLHREPRDFFRISPFHAESRRRLWYSVLEYDLLTCFAKGRVPAVREEEYDCELPASTCEVGLSAASSVHGSVAVERPAEPHISVILAQTLPLRSRVCRAVNSIKLDLDYSEVLRLDAALKSFVREMAVGGIDRPHSFKRILSTILSKRAVIALHAPFVTRALHDPKWSYSRTRCLETASSILTEALSLLDTSPTGDCGPFATIANTCRCEISNSVFLLCHELLAQAVEQRGLAEHFAGSAARWEGRDRRPLVELVQLVERTAAAFDRVLKGDLVSQRTCAWVRLSADLCRAAMMPSNDATIPAMKEAIRHGIQAWRSNRQAQEAEHAVPVDTAVVSVLFAMTLPDLPRRRANCSESSAVHPHCSFYVGRRPGRRCKHVVVIQYLALIADRCSNPSISTCSSTSIL